MSYLQNTLEEYELTAITKAILLYCAILHLLTIFLSSVLPIIPFICIICTLKCAFVNDAIFHITSYNTYQQEYNKE